MELDLKPRKLSFWNEMVPRMLATGNLRMRAEREIIKTNYVTDSTNSWALIASCLCLSILTILCSIGYCKTRRKMKTLLQQNGVPIANRMI